MGTFLCMCIYLFFKGVLGNICRYVKRDTRGNDIQGGKNMDEWMHGCMDEWEGRDITMYVL